MAVGYDGSAWCDGHGLRKSSREEGMAVIVMIDTKDTCAAAAQTDLARKVKTSAPDW